VTHFSSVTPKFIQDRTALNAENECVLYDKLERCCQPTYRLPTQLIGVVKIRVKVKVKVGYLL